MNETYNSILGLGKKLERFARNQKQTKKRKKWLMNYQKHSEMKYFQKGMETDFPYAERKA